MRDAIIAITSLFCLLVVDLQTGAQAATCPVAAPPNLTVPGTLLVGTTDPPPPAGVKPPNQQGFEEDLAEALAGTMCLKVQFAPLAFAGLFPALNARKFDVAMASIGISAEREQSFDFVPYFLGGLRLVVRKDSGLFFETEAGVCGHRIAALAGSIEVRDLERFKPDCPPGKQIDLVIYPNNNEILEQLRKRTVEVIFIDWPPAAYIVQQNPDDFAIGSPILTGEPPGIPRHRIGMMLRKGDTATRDALSQAFAHLQEDGTYQKLLAKWNLVEGDIRNAS
jgi:polar amino acid transport system substrate-binding protein